MTRHLAAITLGLAILAAFPSSARAGENPHTLWVKAKCALCHGEDGAGSTPAGKQTKAPDLRAEEFQKLPDSELIKRVTAGHAKMPSFGRSLNREQVQALVVYIRDIGKPKK